MRSVDGMAPLGFAYLDPALFEIFVRLGFAGFAQTDVALALPAWSTGGPRRWACRPGTGGSQSARPAAMNARQAQQIARMGAV